MVCLQVGGVRVPRGRSRRAVSNVSDAEAAEGFIFNFKIKKQTLHGVSSKQLQKRSAPQIH